MNFLLIEPDSNHKAPNLGLLYVAASLADGKHECWLLNLNNFTDSNPVERTLQIMRQYKIKHIGISVCDVNYDWSQKLAEGIKTAQDAVIIFGGPQVKSIGSDVLSECPAVDYALSGEAEKSIINLLDAIENGSGFEKVAGLIRRNCSKFEMNSIRYHNSLNFIPNPDYSLIGVNRISGYMLLTSRGCPYGCTFCCRNTGKHWVPRKIEDCIREITQAKEKYHIKSFRIVDATFNMQESRVIEFCKAYTDSKLNLPWMASGIRADKLTPASVSAFKDAGCMMLAMGVESIDPKVFKGINKGETLEDVFSAIEMCKTEGIEVGCYMIHGLPGDGYDRSIHYARKLQRLKVDYLMYNQPVPFRGTKLYAWVSENAHLNKDFNWLHARDMNRVAYWEDSFPEKDRIESFKIIQAITRVVNFTGNDPSEIDERIKEIKRFDPDHLSEHLAYMNDVQNSGTPKNLFRLKHNETDIGFIDNYNGLIKLNNKKICNDFSVERLN